MYIKLKRILDIIAALGLVVFFIFPMGIIAAIIALDSKPVIFKQKRPGKNGIIFTIYKFRTMSAESSPERRILPDTERITRFGAFLRKTSLDELPQLWNILKGEMSFIGPRPLLVEYLDLYSQRQALRHNVLPGITGFAQVNGRNAITWEQKFEYDVIYVEKICFFLDVKICLKTIINVLKREGINSGDDVTMRLFDGRVSDEKPKKKKPVQTVPICLNRQK